jgi:hypothetical protein
MERHTEDLIEVAQQLRHLLDDELDKNRSLNEKNEQLKKQIEEAEIRAKLADSRAADAEKRRTTLESLTSDEYKSVVTDLFDEPSRRAARHTARWAAISILVGVLATLVSLFYSARTSSEASNHLMSVIESKIVRHIAGYRDATSADLRASEQRVRNAFQGAMQKTLPEKPPPPLWALVEVPRNGAVQRTVSVGNDLYFRVSVPSGISALMSVS